MLSVNWTCGWFSVLLVTLHPYSFTVWTFTLESPDMCPIVFDYKDWFTTFLFINIQKILCRVGVKAVLNSITLGNWNRSGSEFGMSRYNLGGLILCYHHRALSLADVAYFGCYSNCRTYRLARLLLTYHYGYRYVPKVQMLFELVKTKYS